MVSFESLANKFVAFRPAALGKVCLLDDDCDGPGGDWILDLPYAGLPLEIYRAFDRMHDLPISSEDWEAAVGAIPAEGEEGEAPKNPEAWRVVRNELLARFDGQASDAFLASVAESFVEQKLYDEERYYRYLHYTEVHLVDGASEAFWICDGDLSEFAFDLELGAVPQMVRWNTLVAMPSHTIPRCGWRL